MLSTRALVETSTARSTAAPLGGRVQHTIDPELKAAAARHTSAHVVTRNSHHGEITEFLRQQGLPDITVRVVPKKMSKGEFLKRMFFDQGLEHSSNEQLAELAAPNGAHDTIKPQLGSVDEADSSKVTCLFVDDDIRELVDDTWLRGQPRVHRVLFARAM